MAFAEKRSRVTGSGKNCSGQSEDVSVRGDCVKKSTGHVFIPDTTAGFLLCMISAGGIFVSVPGFLQGINPEPSVFISTVPSNCRLPVKTYPPSLVWRAERAPMVAIPSQV